MGIGIMSVLIMRIKWNNILSKNQHKPSKMLVCKLTKHTISYNNFIPTSSF